MAIYWCWKNAVESADEVCIEEKPCPGSQENWTLVGTARN